MQKKAKGEVALFLTIISSVLILGGIITGIAIVQSPQNLRSNADTTQTNKNAFTSLGTMSQSKLGIFILSNYTNGAKQIIANGPKVIKVMDPHKNNTIDAVREYKQKYPNGVVLMRVYVPQTVQYAQNQAPEESATDYWEKYILPAWNSISEADKAKIDYVNGPNYVENFTWNKLESAAELSWYNRFWVKLITLMKEEGVKPNFGEIYVSGLDATHIPHLIGALEKVKEANGIWSYHGYTLQYTKDLNVEKNTSLHFREFYDYLKSNHPELATIPMVLTEGGVDQNGDAQTSGWQARGSAAQYQSWLEWFDSELKKDPYIIGTTLFQIGDTTWSSFDLEPIASWLAAYIGDQITPTSTSTTPSPTSVPTQPGSGDPSPTGTQTEAGTLLIRVYKVNSQGGQRLWQAQDGTAQVFISGPTGRQTGFSVVMDVPTTSGTCRTDPSFESGGGQGISFECTPGTITWRGSEGLGTAQGRYSVQIYQLPACTAPNCLAPSPYPNPVIQVTAGQTTTANLMVVSSDEPFEEPTPTLAASGYTNQDFQQIMDQYANEEISALQMSAWLTQATRVPGLQKAICYPPNCEAE